MKKRIAITGGIGSGKSSVAQYLVNMGYPVFSCDEIYREVILSFDYIQKISELFPECIIEGTIDRKLLAKTVFKNQEKLSILNSIAHPMIMKTLFEKIQACSKEIVFAEVPLLFEGNYEKDFDKIIVVMRDKEERIRSIMLRDNITKEEALNRISMQFDYDDAEIRLKNCNAFFIKNDSSLSDLKRKISLIVKQIM